MTIEFRGERVMLPAIRPDEYDEMIRRLPRDPTDAERLRIRRTRVERHRVQASIDVENIAMRRVFDALGFMDEGTLRSFMPMAEGPPRDYEMHGTTANDWTRNP